MKRLATALLASTALALPAYGQTAADTGKANPLPNSGFNACMLANRPGLCAYKPGVGLVSMPIAEIEIPHTLGTSMTFANGGNTQTPTAANQVSITASMSTTGVLTVTGTPTGTLASGMGIGGANIPQGTLITSLGTGTGGAGTYNTNATPAAAIASEPMQAGVPYSETLTSNGAAQFQWQTKLGQPLCMYQFSPTGAYVGNPLCFNPGSPNAGSPNGELTIGSPVNSIVYAAPPGGIR